jgi:hypothetical protein
MKEYIAKTGGRYTYNDDLLNLQELAMSMTAIFDGCSNFIISGCHAAGGKISPGFVWINGRVRYFEGAADPVFPYFIWEENHFETISYAGDVNKHGRCNYLTAGGAAVPQVNDEVTGELPGYIELREEYAPRFIDKFIGRYAVLLDSPFARQTVKKDLVLAGTLSVEKDLESKTSVSVVNTENKYALRSIVKESGNALVGLYAGGVLLNGIEMAIDGAFSLWRRKAKIASFDYTGLKTDCLGCTVANVGALRIEGNNLLNFTDPTDDGTVEVNRYAYNGSSSRYRGFIVYDGRTANPLLAVEGKSSRVTVGGAFAVTSGGQGIVLKNSTYAKTDARLVNILEWQDKNGARIGYAGYIAANTSEMTLRNEIGNLVLHSTGWVDVRGELRVGGVNIADTYMRQSDCNEQLAGKVDKVTGKGLSTEDFTAEYRKKLDSIMGGTINSGGDGFVSAGDVEEALRGKLSVGSNLADIESVPRARANLEVWSKTEGDGRYLRISESLSEFTSLSAAQVEGKTPEQIIAMKEERQRAVRDNIDAERKGTGEQKLAKASNLSDVADKNKARLNLGVYSTEDIDRMMSGKLGSDQGYSGIPFTAELKSKLDGIKTGVFAGTVVDGAVKSQVEGYVTTSAVVGQLSLKAPRLLEGYSASDKKAVAANIGVYSTADADGKFAALSQGLADMVGYRIRQGRTTTEAKKELRDNIGAAASADLDGYIRRDGKLSDLILSTDSDRKLACQVLGAAWAPEYEQKITDTGWLNCGGENGGTLFARQIGSIVCVQGRINTARRSSNNWGSIATIPNTISPPRFGILQTLGNFDDDTWRNRGCRFVIQAGSRTILMHERGTYNWDTELSFTYMI